MGYGAERPASVYPFTSIVHRPDPAVLYFEAYKNIGRKLTRLSPSGDVARDVIMAAVNALPANGGNLGVKGGDYPLNNTILLSGDGKSVVFDCEGRNAVSFSPAQGVNALTLSNNVRAILRNFTIRLPTTGVAGHGIYGDAIGDARSSVNPQIKNVTVEGGNASTSHWAVYIRSAYGLEMKDVALWGYGLGCLRYENATTDGKLGDTEFLKGYNTLYIRRNNGIGIELVGNASQELAHLKSKGFTYIQGLTGLTGTRGLRCEYTDRAGMSRVGIENVTIGVQLAATAIGGTFDDLYIMPNIANATHIECAGDSNVFKRLDLYCGGLTGQTVLRVLSGALRNRFKTVDIYVSAGNTATVIDDAGTIEEAPNIFNDLYFRAFNATYNITKQTHTVIRRLHGYQGSRIIRSEDGGTATIPNGQSSVTVNHRIYDTPAIVVCSGRDSDTDRVRCSARTSTQLTFTVPDPVGGDRVIDYYAQYTR